MLNITCFVGRLRESIEISFPLLLDGQSISGYYSTGSSDAAGNQDINLIIDSTSRFNNSIIAPSVNTDAVGLQQSLSALTQNPTNVDRVNNIGLILADKYEPDSSLLGLMFDVGFNPSGVTPVKPSFTSVAREGCAIFLNAINAIRPAEEDYRKEIVFTAIHELGHVFNLWHLDSPSTFMSRTRTAATFPSEAYFFQAVHRNFLHQASTSPFVWPGGSPFESRGPFGPGPENLGAANSPVKSVSLKIDVEQKEFWYFEPIELEIEVKCAKGVVSIPNRVDPGYEDFGIYITKPDGSVFRYKSPRHYCQNTSIFTVSPRTPFRRDISIFGQSGGYTFSSPGIYKIKCSYKIGDNQVLHSNIVEINLKAPMMENGKYLLLEKKLTQQQTSLLLYHRSGNYKQSTIEELKELAITEKKQTIGTNVNYALLRYQTKKQTTRIKKPRAAMIELLKRALDDSKLSTNRRKKLTSILHQF